MSEQGREEECNSLDAKRKAHIVHVLESTGQDVPATAALLQISVPELMRWMRKFEIPPCNACTESVQE